MVGQKFVFLVEILFLLDLRILKMFFTEFGSLSWPLAGEFSLPNPQIEQKSNFDQKNEFPSDPFFSPTYHHHKIT